MEEQIMPFPGKKKVSLAQVAKGSFVIRDEGKGMYALFLHAGNHKHRPEVILLYGISRPFSYKKWEEKSIMLEDCSFGNAFPFETADVWVVLQSEVLALQGTHEFKLALKSERYTLKRKPTLF